ncbi:hypothetical protein PSTG_07363 [Puccinia striiformis f. sp. tritici PST-78]|uniref:DH domain-containing protein n=1 Tax=Puccinia striiformis f. sp. tritici PST-78 TaxID=1165861 RepID=A0A0L0VJI9_9BASI|nr:hypothetical protein PSTG_07363 [Puccinia striiformis f. sp. tritici PST-78]
MAFTHPQSQPPSPHQSRSDEQYAIGPHTVPGPRDQRSLSSRYRLAPQPLTTRHSEGSQYASSSNWTPSTTGSRSGYDSTTNGMRSSIASRDSRFTAETDYDDYCHPKPIVLQQSPQNVGSHSHPLNLSVSASWHSGDQPNLKYTGGYPTSQAKPGEDNKNTPTLLSLIDLDQTPRDQHDMVGLGITSDETITHQSHWDDFDDSPSLHSSSQIPSQAVALVEDGLGCIVDTSNSKCPLEKLAVPENTTHLLLAKNYSPFLIGALLSSRLSTIAATLVVLDISECGLTSLPSAIAHCEVLEELNVSGNVLASGELPVFLSNLTALKVLASDRCGLYQIAHPYNGLLHLRDWSVRYNHLRCLPSWLCLLPRLEILLVDGNEFEPPWLELVEPLLSANIYARAEPPPPPIGSCDITESRHFASSYPSPVTSSVGSTLRSLPDPSHNARTPPDEHRPNATAERSKRGRRNLGGSESAWVTSASTLASDHLDENGERPPSPCSAEGSNHPSSPRSGYLRRLHSINDTGVGSISRPPSAHETPTHSNLPLMDPHMSSISRDDAADGFRPPSSITYHPRRPSSSSVMQQGNPATPLEYADGSNHPAGSRHDPKALSPTETSQAASTNHQKKSFGFLKKMSLGKLRREPVRSRASSTASGSIYNRSSSNLGPEAHHLDPSKLMSPDDLTPQESDEHHQGDRSSKSSADDPPPPPSAKKRLHDRRSFLKLEDHFLPLNSTSIRHPGVIDEHEDPSNPQSPKVQTSHSSHGEAREPNSAATFSSFQPPPSSAASRWSSLRSIMMYLRDVHDLSGDFARVPGNIIASGARPMLSNGVSRATSTKQPYPTTSIYSDGKSTPSMPYPYGAIEFEPESLDNGLSNGTLAVSPTALPTFEPPKVTENAQKRSKVMEEIVATEKSYIKGLKELSDIYITSASLMVSGSIGKEKEPVVPPAERKVVFNNVEAIIGFHVDVLLPDFQAVMDSLRQKQSAIAMADFKEPASGSDELSKRCQETESQLTNFAAEELARVFIRHAAFLKLYSTYITQFDTALERLREWSVTAPAASAATPAWTPSSMATSNNPASNHHSTLSGGQKKRLKTYMKRCRAHPSHTQMNLESYLLMPVQRLPRYKLLLENLVSCTPDLSCTSAREIQSRNLGGVLTDKKPQPLTPNKVAVEALNIVSAVTSEMNERKRDSEGRQRLLYWQQRFGNKFRSPLVQPHRTLIKEGTMSLMRTVKLTTKDSATIGAGSSHPSARIRVPVLNTDSQPVAMIVLLCTDLLVLVKDPGDGGTATNQSPASLFQALRLAQHSKQYMSLPATIFGADQTMIRFVDSRAIFYFQCDCQRSAAAWMVAINQQVPLL